MERLPSVERRRMASWRVSDDTLLRSAGDPTADTASRHAAPLRTHSAPGAMLQGPMWGAVMAGLPMPSALRLAKNAIPTQRESHWNGRVNPRVNPGRDAVGGTRSNPTAKALGISFICDNLPSPTVGVAWRATPMTALFLHAPISTMHAPIREPTRWQNDNSTSPGFCRRAMALRPGGGTGPAPAATSRAG